MSNQPDHPTLLIPGPIEFDDAVLQSMSHFRYVVYSYAIFYGHLLGVFRTDNSMLFVARAMLAPLLWQLSERLCLC